MGHGVDAALIMATVRTYLHVNATQCGDAAQGRIRTEPSFSIGRA